MSRSRSTDHQLYRDLRSAVRVAVALLWDGTYSTAPTPQDIADILSEMRDEEVSERTVRRYLGDTDWSPVEPAYLAEMVAAKRPDQSEVIVELRDRVEREMFDGIQNRADHAASRLEYTQFIKFLFDGRMPTLRELAKQVGVPERTLRRARARLGE